MLMTDGGQAEKDKAIEQHWFRSERQSLRRYVGFFNVLLE